MMQKNQEQERVRKNKKRHKRVRMFRSNKKQQRQAIKSLCSPKFKSKVAVTIG